MRFKLLFLLNSIFNFLFDRFLTFHRLCNYILLYKSTKFYCLLQYKHLDFYTLFNRRHLPNNEIPIIQKLNNGGYKLIL